jgi:hypothetical protein
MTLESLDDSWDFEVLSREKEAQISMMGGWVGTPHWLHILTLCTTYYAAVFVVVSAFLGRDIVMHPPKN